MSGSGGFAVSQRNNGVERFYNPAMRPEQQHQHQQALFYHHQHMQQLQMEAAMRAGYYPAAPPPMPPLPPPIPVDNRSRTGSEDSPATALPKQPPPVSPPAAAPLPPSPSEPVSSLTNLDRFLESVAPVVSVSEVQVSGGKRKKGKEPKTQFFTLSDLWEAFSEWSVYGVGVPLLLKGVDKVDQYYVPSLSGIQLYVDPAKHRTRSGEEGGGAEAPREAHISGRVEEAENSSSRGMLLYEYFDPETPHHRKTLFEKIGILASQCPELKTYRSCDLMPSSWIAIAWYPIYRIPVGPTLRDLETSFLTLHRLSTHPTSHGVSASANTSSKMSLPVLGLASYKFMGSLVSPSRPHELEQSKTLLQAFDDWLQQLNVTLPDFQFFRGIRR